MQVLLVQPNYWEARRSRGGTWGVNPPIGLAYIAAILEQHNIPVKILDANALNLTESDVVNYVHANDPDIVGISLLTPAHTYAINIAQAINNSNCNGVFILPSNCINDDGLFLDDWSLKDLKEKTSRDFMIYHDNWFAEYLNN